MHGQITVQVLGAAPSLNRVLDEREEGTQGLQLPIPFSTSGVISVSLGVGSVRKSGLAFVRDKGGERLRYSKSSGWGAVGLSAAELEQQGC